MSHFTKLWRAFLHYICLNTLPSLNFRKIFKSEEIRYSKIKGSTKAQRSLSFYEKKKKRNIFIANLQN